MPSPHYSVSDADLGTWGNCCQQLLPSGFETSPRWAAALREGSQAEGAAVLWSMMLSSLDSEDSGTPGREGAITLPTTGPLLTLSTDDPGGVKAPQSPAEGTGVDTSLLSPSLSLPLLLHLLAHRLWGQGLGGVPCAEEPSHDLASGHPGSQRRVSLDSTGSWKFLPTSSLKFK